ncbi:LxmA leader domain family RiPP [Citricoccus sp. NPDC079358]|uniref:LxmA leader domain family RiPP n=1 Tax=Citricoccus sp. NPDC079358 TaxID=3154653 RepID=UPI00344E3EDB
MQQNTLNLVEGYRNYSNAAELNAFENTDAAAVSPTPGLVAFATASSAYCAMYSLGAGAGGVTTTLAAGC